MSQIHKRPVHIYEGNTSSKKCKIDGNLEDLKLKIERILNEYPVSNKASTQNITVVGNSSLSDKAVNVNLNNFTSQMQANTLNSANLVKIPLIKNRTYQNNTAKPSNNNNKSTSSNNNLIYLTGAPTKSKTITNSLLPRNNSDLSETDLQVLLQNFYKLEGEEQQMLISHLKKLEKNKPDLVDKLKKFVRISSPEQDKSHSEYDCDLNDLDDLDLDDILEETVNLITESESDEDCIVVQMFKKDPRIEDEKISEILQKSAEISTKQNSTPQNIKINLLSKHGEKDETIKNINQINNLGKGITKPPKENKINNKDLNRTKEKINKNHLAKIIKPAETKICNNYLKQTKKMAEQINRKRNPKTENNSKHQNKEIKQKTKNGKTEKRLYQSKTNNLFVKRIQERKSNDSINNFIQNPYKIFPDLDSSSPINQEMQAKYFGYRNYKEMQQYLEMTGIYCAKDSYFSFSDNA